MGDQEYKLSQSDSDVAVKAGLSQSSSSDVSQFMSEVNEGDVADSPGKVSDGFVRLFDFVAKQKRHKSKSSVLAMAIAKYRFERDRFGNSG